MTPLQPSADNLAAVNSDAPEVAVDLDDRLRAAYVKAHDAEEAWLESTGHLYDPSLPIDAGIRAVLREAQAHPSRGVVDEDVVMQAERAFWPAYNEALRVHGTKADCHAIGMRAALQAAVLPASNNADTLSQALHGLHTVLYSGDWHMPDDTHAQLEGIYEDAKNGIGTGFIDAALPAVPEADAIEVEVIQTAAPNMAECRALIRVLRPFDKPWLPTEGRYLLTEIAAVTPAHDQQEGGTAWDESEKHRRIVDAAPMPSKHTDQPEGEG